MNGSFEKKRKIVEKMERTDIKQGSKVHLIAQELELIKMLAGNEQQARNKALKNLNKWLQNRSNTIPFTEEDLQRIWKGLYYLMWMSDKPLVQEECADKISKLIHFKDLTTSLLFFKAGLYILSQEWCGIQQLRLDKFLMLVRRLLREMLNVLKEKKYITEGIQSFNKVLLETVLNKTNNVPVGLFMHFVEIFLEELAKVSNGKIQPSQVLEFVKPFIQCLASSTDGRQIGHLRKFIFTYLIRQSKMGLQYQEKYEAWRQAGFPGSIDSMQKIKVDTNDSEESDNELESEQPSRSRDKPLDPRAGRVDVEIPRLPFKSKDIASALLEFKFDSKSSAQSRAMIRTLVDQFTSLANGTYPLGIKKIEVKDKNEDINIRKAANRLIKLEQKMLGKNKKRKRDKENDEVVVIEEKRKKVEKNLTTEMSKKKKMKTKEVGDENLVNGHSSDKVKRRDKNKLKKLKEGKPEQNGDTLTLHNENDGVKPMKNKKSSGKFDTKNKNRSVSPMDNTEIKSNIVKAKNRPKTKVHSKKNNKNSDPNETIECIFERNSGTWVVYEVENSVPADEPKLSNSDEDFTPAKSSKKKGTNDFEESKDVGILQSTPIQSNRKINLHSPVPSDDSLEMGLVPVKLFESPPNEKEIFPKSEWDEPLQEGEYEICIPSRKHINRMKNQANNKNKSVHELINTTLAKIKGKSRMSLDSRLVNNPFSTPNSTKKVKINTKLNKSQEVYEHYSSVKSSPAIPFDANKKPSKPLLKPTAVSTPINPFYKKQLHI